MTSHGHIPFVTHSIGQGDLDLQPVREAKVRVLNDIPKESVAPHPPPQVKFNFVDVTFPKSVQKPTKSVETNYGSTSRNPNKGSNTEKEGNARDQTRYNKENSKTDHAQRNMERDRREYLRRLLKRGMPVWEEVPVEERATKIIGGTNPFRHHPYSSHPPTSNVTHRNLNKQKSSKVIHAVWEDVKDGFKNSYPSEHCGDLIDTPAVSLGEDKEMDLKSRAEKLNQTLRNSGQIGLNAAYGTPSYYQSESSSSHELHLKGHTIPPEVYCRTHQQAINPSTLSSELYKAEVSQAHSTTKEFIDDCGDEDSSQVQDPLQNTSEYLESKESVAYVQDVHSSMEEGKLQFDMIEQGRVSRPVMKKAHSGRIDNDAISSISWWPGDKLYKERSKNEEEEKHEKESTREKKGKRDLSTPPTGTQKRRQVMADQEVTEEKVVKSPVRVRHYEPDEVRKYIRDKQSERAKATKELQWKQEQEKIQRNERMRELAIKTKQLSQTSKKGSHKPTAARLSQEQNQLEQHPIINWGAQKEWDPENYPEAVPTQYARIQSEEQNLHSGVPLIPFKDRGGKLSIQSEVTRDASHIAVVSPKKVKHGETYTKKKNRRNGKKKKRQSLSDSEAISDIVSRTVEECERKVKSSSVSVESLSSLSSYSCSSSDVESRSSLSQSESLSSGLDLTPKERAVALGQLAQKLTSKVTQEAGSFSQREKCKEDVPDMPQKVMYSNKGKQAIRRPATSANVLSDPRAFLSLSQIETMSVEELIAKMTAMLPIKLVNERRSNAPQNDPQSKSRNIYERQYLEHNVQTQSKTMDLSERHSQDVPMRESLQRVLTEQLPMLVVPDVPKLKLSNIEKKLQESQKIAQEDLSTLPGHNIMESVQDCKSQADERKQVHLTVTSYKLQHRHAFPQSERYLTGEQHGQSQIFSRTHRNNVIALRNEYEHAALVIQSAYRGYRVRKITNSLMNRQMLNKGKNTNEARYSKGLSSITQVNVAPKLKKFFRNSDRVIKGGSEISLEGLSKEGRKQETSWQDIQSMQGAFKPHKESHYVSQRSDLPEWMKPYFALCETGDVNNFLEAHISKQETGIGEGAESRSSCNMISQSPECVRGILNHPHLISEKSVHDVTLTEGPLSDLEKETVSCFDKETQTSYIKYLDTRDKEKSGQVMQDFIDLKSFSKRRGQILKEESVDSYRVESCETSRRALNSAQLGLSKREHEETLKESPSEEMLGGENSLQITENEAFESGSIEPNLSIEEGPLFETSQIVDASNVSSSVAVEEASAPHELLAEGVHHGPASLRLRLNAELMYQDTLGKALNHLHNVEQLNILSRSRQEAMALSQTSALQQQNMKLIRQRENENEMKIQEEEAKRKEDYERRLKERLKQQEEALQKVEKIEKEARSRFAELEREVRSKAEQVIAQAAERVPQPSIVQSDVIAAAAVAAVGATISQWKQLRPVRGHDSHGSIIFSDGSLSPKISSDQNDASSSDKSQSEICSAKSLSRERRSTNEMSSFVSERLDKDKRLSKNSVTEKFPTGDSVSKTLEAPEVVSDVTSSQDSIPENITSMENSVPTMDQNMSVNESSNRSDGNGFKRFNAVSISQSTFVSGMVDSLSSCKTKVSSDEVAFASNLEPDVSSVKDSGTVTEAILENDASGVTQNSEVETVSNVLPHSSTLKSSSFKDHKKYQVHEIIPSKKSHGSPLVSSSKHKLKERKKEEKDASDMYSESFEVDSESEDSSTSQLQRDQGTHGDLALVVSSGSILNDLDYKPSTHGGGGITTPMPGVGGEGALSVTVSVVESLLKEEEVHHQHQKTLLKLQEQSLVEEAKWKLTTLQSEGGPGVRRRQRAIVLQLREQKAHLKRLRETQNIGAQQRRLMLLQLHHLLTTTTNLSGYSSKGYLTAPRGHSPNPASPRLTPRLMEMLSSSSSDAPDDVTFSLLMRGRDSDSSSPSESGGGREKRRCHSEDRLKISSGRHHEKRWTAEIEALQQQILHEDKEILRLKSKSPYDIHDKDSVKLKRKGDFISKRSRDKKEKSSGSVAPLSVLVHGSRTLIDNALSKESMVATTHDSQSSIPEEGGSETVSHSDAASSVSEQEGLVSTSQKAGSSKSKEVSHSNRVPSYGVSEREASETLTFNPKIISSELEFEEIKEEYSDSKDSEKSSSPKTVNNGETSRSLEDRHSYDSSERIPESSEKSNAVESEVYDKSSESQESSIRTKLSTSMSVKSGWSKPESIIPEDITDNSKTRTTSNSSWHSADMRTDSGARSSEGKSSEDKSFSQKSSTRGLPLPLKVPLSPRSLHRQHRRYSSESDDSFTLSQTETASDISDGEGKLLALKEELAVRRAEAERLKKEKRRLRRERLASQERALRQQISTYDAYIQHARMELEKESKELQQVSMVRPLIKKPQVAETKKSRLSESITSPEKSDVSDVSLVSEGSKSDQSSISRPQETGFKEDHVKPQESIKLQELHLKQMGEASLKDQDVVAFSFSNDGETEEKASSSKEVTLSETAKSERENESEKTSSSSSISENLDEESVSEHLQDDSSKKSPSQESSVESDHTHSQASSTETIVHSPLKLDPTQKDEVGVFVSEVNAALLEVLKDNEKDHHADTSKGGASDARIIVEGEKLEIFIPTSDFKSSEAEELIEGNTNTSAEQSICEEVFDDSFKENDIENSLQQTGFPYLLHSVTVENKVHEETDESNSLISENKELSLKSELAPETNIPGSLTCEAKISGPESKKHSPTLDRQRLVDDISNNILAIMMKDTNQLFTSIVKDKVNISKASQVMGRIEDVKESIVTELRGEVLEPQKDAHSCSTVPEEETSGSKPSCSSKSHILQRVNELIGESGPGSPHLTCLSSPRSGDVQLTFDLSPESSPSISPTRAKAAKVEEDGEVELSKGTPSLLPGEGTAILDAAVALEEEHDSLSPSHDVVKAEEYKLDTETLTTRLLNLAAAPELDLEARLSQLNENTEFSVEGIEGDWFDDDFWTSSDNRKKQQQLKAEEERITAEIARLEELQHLQQKYPGLVIREVPNKPPPPYTPPQVTSPPSPGSSLTPARPPAYTNSPTSPILPEAQPISPTHSSSTSHRLSKADQRKLAAHITQVVPVSEEEALPIIDNALDTLYEAWQNNVDPGDIPPPPHTTLAKAFSLSSFNNKDMHEDEKTSSRAFHLLLFCLARELLSVPYKLQHATQLPPWMKQVLPQARMLGMVHTKSRPRLFSHVREQVKVLFGWKPPLQKESLLIRWAQKHRDLVDQVLVKELQAEEASWTNYDEDEAAVKTKVAGEILDTLLSETVSLVSSILVKKLGYIAH